MILDLSSNSKVPTVEGSVIREKGFLLCKRPILRGVGEALMWVPRPQLSSQSTQYTSTLTYEKMSQFDQLV